MKEELPLRQTGTEAMWLRVPRFYLDAHSSKWSNLNDIFRTSSGDNGCTFEGNLTVPAMGVVAELMCNSGECQVANGNQEV